MPHNPEQRQHHGQQNALLNAYQHHDGRSKHGQSEFSGTLASNLAQAAHVD